MKPPRSVYVIRFSEMDHKVGVSYCVERRLRRLRAVGAVRVVRSWPRPSGDALDVEGVAHSLLAGARLDVGSCERFGVSEDEACQAVERAIALVDRCKPRTEEAPAGQSALPPYGVATHEWGNSPACLRCGAEAGTAAAAFECGVSKSTIYKWRRALDAPPVHDPVTDEVSE